MNLASTIGCTVPSENLATTTSLLFKRTMVVLPQ